MGSKQKIESMRSGKPGRIFLSTVEDPVSKTGEIADTKRNAFEDLGLIVAAFRESIGPRETNGIEDLCIPIVVGFDAGIELFNVVVLCED